MDGHLVGSIGEIMAAYYYGIGLYEASAPTHDSKASARIKYKYRLHSRIELLSMKNQSILLPYI